MTRYACSVALAAIFTAVPVVAQSTPPPTQQPPPTQTPPPPKPVPFPGANAPAKPGTSPATTPVVPKTNSQEGGSFDPRLTGVPIYPGAELLDSFAGSSNQHVFLFGSSMPYTDIVAYYRTQLRNGGNEVFKTPGMHQFDLGSFRSETMAYRPSVVVKDYGAMADSSGYLHVTGTAEKRYRTVIQIVPVTK